MMTKKQLEEAAICWKKDCDKCICKQTGGYFSCVMEAAQTAMAYREVLEQLEWQSFAGEYGFVENCPMCGGAKPEHMQDCALAALLKESEGKEG